MKKYPKSHRHKKNSGLEAMTLLKGFERNINNVYDLGKLKIKESLKKLFEFVRFCFFHIEMIWTRQLGSRLVFYVALIILISLLIIIIIGIAEFYSSISNLSIQATIVQIYQKISLENLVYLVIGFLLLWVSLWLTARETLIVLIFGQVKLAKVLDYLIKMLSALPTLILGNAVLILADRLGIHPQDSVSSLLFILLALTIIGLPTVLQIGQEVIKDYDRRRLEQAITLGIGRVVIGKKIVMPTLYRSFNAAITVALSRIIIEGYIVVNSVAFKSHIGFNIIRDHQDILDIFSGVYSTMTIQSNANLVVLLFIIAVFINFWSFSITIFQKP